MLEEDCLHTLTEHSLDGMLLLSPDSTIRYVNPAASDLLGYHHGDLLNRSLHSLVHPQDLDGVLQRIQRLLIAPQRSFRHAFRQRHRTGDWRWFEGTASNLLHHERSWGLLLALRDITERRQHEEMLARQAFTDPVTGLPNRTVLLDRLEQRLKQRDHSGHSVAVLSLDLDQFKAVNDELGHAAGDELLRQVGARLQQTLREGDTVARFGGDEFVVLIGDSFSTLQAAQIGERLLHSLVEPLRVADRDIVINASLGIAVATVPGVAVQELLREADIALYRAKSSGKGRYVIFDGPVQAAIEERGRLQSELHQALQYNELCLYYQPTIDLETRRISAVECLLRWRHRRRGLLKPQEFLPIAEETMLIGAVGSWVRREACKQAVAWNAQLPRNARVPVSINISHRELHAAGWAEDVASTLTDTGLDPQCLGLEISETAILHDLDRSTRALQALKRVGVRLAIDDFGTASGSLRLLTYLPIDGIKIDCTFPRQPAGGCAHPQILEAIIALARTLAVDVTVKSIETEHHRDVACWAHCRTGQGYLLARPQSQLDMTALLQRSL